MFHFFVAVYFLIHFSSFKPDRENNVKFDTVSSKRAKFDEVELFKNINLSS